jgi:hypothetical protein
MYIIDFSSLYDNYYCSNSPRFLSKALQCDQENKNIFRNPQNNGKTIWRIFPHPNRLSYFAFLLIIVYLTLESDTTLISFMLNLNKISFKYSYSNMYYGDKPFKGENHTVYITTCGRVVDPDLAGYESSCAGRIPIPE